MIHFIQSIYFSLSVFGCSFPVYHVPLHTNPTSTHPHNHTDTHSPLFPKPLTIQPTWPASRQFTVPTAFVRTATATRWSRVRPSQHPPTLPRIFLLKLGVKLWPSWLTRVNPSILEHRHTQTHSWMSRGQRFGFFAPFTQLIPHPLSLQLLLILPQTPSWSRSPSNITITFLF